MSNQSIQRAVAILSLFSVSRPQIKVAQIAKELNLAVPTAHGLVRTLVDEGLMAQNPKTNEYHLGLRLNELGAIQMATLEINQRAAIPATYLARDTEFFVHVGVMERDAIVVTYSTSPLMAGGSVGPYLGTRVPTYCTSIGRVILAFLPREEVLNHLSKLKIERYTAHTITDQEKILSELDAIRERGFAIIEKEYVDNLISFGAPIFGAQGQVLGGISINGNNLRLKSENFEEISRKLLDAANTISKNTAIYY